MGVSYYLDLDKWDGVSSCAVEDTQTGLEVDAPYDDAKDHDPCPDCNPSGKSPNAGWYCPFVGPRMKCDTCDGAGWV